MDSITAALSGIYVIETGLTDAFLDGIVFDRFAGTGIALLVTSTDKVIVAFNESQSGVATFTDNTGRDLLKNSAGEALAVKWESKHIPNDDESLRKQLFVQFFTRANPSATTTQLKLDVNLRLQLAANLAAKVAKNVSLTPGPLELDDLDIKISHVGKPEFNLAFPFAVQLDMNGPAVDLIQSVSFLDSDGKSLALATFRKSTEASRRLVEYYFSEEIQLADLEFGVWQDLENADVPFKGDITLGLSPATP